MRVARDRRRFQPDIVITMTMAEFRETVEWLELIDPRDGATQDWRQWLDAVDPPGDD